MSIPLKTLHAEIRKFLKCFPTDKELHNIKFYFPEELRNGPFIELEIQRAPEKHWELYRIDFSVTSVKKLKRN